MEGVFDLTAGGAVLDTPLMQTREGIAVPDMLNGQCILLQLMHHFNLGSFVEYEIHSSIQQVPWLTRF